MPRTAKVFMTNRSQAVRLPKDFQFATDEVLIRKVGDDVILSPRPRDWRSYLESAPVASDGVHGRGRGPARPGTGGLMPRFMLDTDTCSYIMKRSHPLVLKRLQAVPGRRRLHVGRHQSGAAVRRRGVTPAGSGCRSTRGLPALRRGHRLLGRSARFTTPRSAPT